MVFASGFPADTAERRDVGVPFGLTRLQSPCPCVRAIAPCDGGGKRHRAARYTGVSRLAALQRPWFGLDRFRSSFASTHRAIPKPTVTLTRSVSSPGAIGTDAASAAD